MTEIIRTYSQNLEDKKIKWFKTIWELIETFEPKTTIDWYYISKNPNVNYKYINNNNKKCWIVEGLLQNVNISFPNKEFFNNFINTCNNKTKTKLWNIICSSDKIYPNFILEYIDYPLNWSILSKNKKIPSNFILSYTSEPWDWNEICKREDIKIEFFLNHKLTYAFEISKRKDITQEFISDNYDKNWDWEYLTSAKNNEGNYILETTFIFINIEKLPFSIVEISKREDIDLSFYFLNKDIIDFSWYHIVRKKNFTWDVFIKNYDFLNKKQEIELETCEFITANLILLNDTFPFDFKKLSSNENIPWEIFKHKQKFLDWTKITKNKNIRLDIITKNYNSPWDWNVLHENPNVTCDFVKENLEKNWNWDEIYKIKNIDLDFLIFLKDNKKLTLNCLIKGDDNLKNIREKYFLCDYDEFTIEENFDLFDSLLDF